MIRVITGTPGSGKSCYAVVEMVDALAAGKCVATNIALAPDFADRLARRDPKTWLSPRARDRKAAAIAARVAVLDESSHLRRVWPVDRREGGTLVVIDEAHALLDSRETRAPDRQEWITWLTQHRKLGLDVIFVVQHLEMLDANLRRLVEWEVRLRDLRRARAYGVPVPVPVSVGHWFWATMRAPQRTQMFRPKRAHGLFDTTATLHGISGARPADAIVLPATAPTARQRLGAEPEPGPDTGTASEERVATPLAPSERFGVHTVPENTEGATVGTVTPSREDALPASLDAGP